MSIDLAHIDVLLAAKIAANSSRGGLGRLEVLLDIQ